MIRRESPMTGAFDSLKTYVGFSKEDELRLKALAPLLKSEMEPICEVFYDAIWANPSTAKVLEDPKRIKGLRRSLKQWMMEILAGPFDDAYYQKHLRIGRRHVQVGLEQQYMFTAMNILRQGISDVARARLGDEKVGPTLRSVNRILDLELAIMLHSYAEDRTTRELEDLRDLLMTHLPITAILLDDKRRINTVTGSYQPWLFEVPPSAGTYRPLEEVIAAPLMESVDLNARSAQAVDSGHDIVLPRVDVTLQGKERNLRITIVPLDHPIAKVLIHIEDLTDIIAFEQRARHAENLAELGEMSAAIAHELRNPLAGFSGTIQVIQNSLPPEDKRRQIMDKVLQQINRLDQLVTDLLQFARPHNATCQATDLNPLAQRIASHIAMSKLGATVISGEGGAYCDPGLLGQALQNLTQNAWQAGATQVEIHIENGRILIFDDGPGIPEGKERSIFKPFFTTRTRGTGLGLPNTQRCLESMGGSLRLVESTLGGAGFEITLMQEG